MKTCFITVALSLSPSLSPSLPPPPSSLVMRRRLDTWLWRPPFAVCATILTSTKASEPEKCGRLKLTVSGDLNRSYTSNDLNYITAWPFLEDPSSLYKAVGPHGIHMSRCGPAVRRYDGKQKDLGSIRFGCPFSSKIVVYGHCLVTLPTQLMKH